MKDFNLLKQYELCLMVQRIVMPIMSAVLIIIGIVLSTDGSKTFWVGIILASIGLIVLGLFFLIRKYLIKKINELKDKEDKQDLED